MSISNLLQPNPYNLNCNNLLVNGNSNIISTTFAQFPDANTSITAPLFNQLFYKTNVENTLTANRVYTFANNIASTIISENGLLNQQAWITPIFSGSFSTQISQGNDVFIYGGSLTIPANKSGLLYILNDGTNIFMYGIVSA